MHGSTFFSVIVPTFDREGVLLRCLDSVWMQDERNFEVIVVDDASRDGTATVLRAITDARLRVLNHPHNRGVCEARNSGIDAACGRWLVFLDSDDELVEGALAKMREAAESAPPDLHALWFRCQLDNGRISPDPLPANCLWDYVGYVAFLEATLHQPRDMIRCVRRECFDALRYPAGRMLEAGFHLDFAQRFRSRLYPDVLRLYHQDAPQRLGALVRQLDRQSPFPVGGEVDFLRDSARGYGELLQQHASVLTQHAPRLHRQYLRRAASSAFNAGDASSARHFAWTLIRHSPLSVRGWRLLLATLFSRGGPRGPIARADVG